MQNKPLIAKVTAKLNPEQATAFTDLVAEFEPLCEGIEKRLATTKNHYGDYLRWATSQLLALALICAGANAQGVADAAKINSVNL